MNRILANLGIPNAVAFRLSDPVLNVVALLFERVVKDRQMVDVVGTKRLTKANRYLGKSFRRLLKYARNGEFEKFDFLSKKLLLSYAFQVQAYNSVFPKWLSVKAGTVAYHLRYLRTLCYQLSTDLKYKRVWIDKKEGDFARPLGVPELVWRVYLRMLTNLGEVYLKGRGKYSNFQHGGRPGKGVLTCLEEMIRKLDKFKRVYEFDLKGFFDHIAKDAVRDFFKEVFLGDIYSKLLMVKPTAYVLPPQEKDEPLQRYRKIMDYLLVKSEGPFLPSTWHGTAVRYTGMFHSILIHYTGKGQVVTNGTADALENYPSDIIEVVFWENYDENSPTDLPRNKNFEAPWIARRSLSSIYKMVMEEDMARMPAKTAFIIEPESEEERARGRDEWKDLNLPEQGIPQGTSFGPMLASTIGAYYLRGIPNLLMYVDDGMVFLEPDAPSPEKEIEERLSVIKVSLAREKSGIREFSSLLTEGIKFLGTRTRVIGERLYGTSMSSETRRGIAKPFPQPSKSNFNAIIDKLFTEGMISFSKQKVLRWYFNSNSSRLLKLLTGSSLHIAMKWGFFGNLLAEAYSPTTTPSDMRKLISEGMRKAEEEIRKQIFSVGSTILSSHPEVISDGGEVIWVKPTLFNLSTLGCELLLEKGVNSIRRNYRNCAPSDRPVGASYAVKQDDMVVDSRFETYYVGNTPYVTRVFYIRRKTER